MKRATQTCNLSCNIAAKRVAKRCCTFYHPRSNLPCNKSGCCRLRKVVAQSREQFYFFATKSAHVVRFTGLRQTYFTASDVRNSRIWHDSGEILSNQKSVFTQFAASFICSKTGLNVGGKTQNIAFRHVLHQFAKQVTRLRFTET